MSRYGDIGDIVGPGLSDNSNLLAERVGDNRVASEDIELGDPIRILTDGRWARCIPITYEGAAAVAVAAESQLAGEELLGIYTGTVEDPSMTHSNSQALFIGSDGKLSNTANTIIGQYSTLVGKAIFSGLILVQCEEPVEIV